MFVKKRYQGKEKDTVVIVKFKDDFGGVHPIDMFSLQALIDLAKADFPDVPTNDIIFEDYTTDGTPCFKLYRRQSKAHKKALKTFIDNFKFLAKKAFDRWHYYRQVSTSNYDGGYSMRLAFDLSALEYLKKQARCSWQELGINSATLKNWRQAIKNKP